MPQIQHKVSENLQENASVSAESAAVPSFKFFVTSEEGIQLFVDVNSSLLDCSKRLHNGICVCPNLQDSRFQSFREEVQYLRNNCKQIESSFFWNTISRMSGDDSIFGYSSNSANIGKNDVLLKHSDEESGPSEIFKSKQFIAVQKVPKHLKEQRENQVPKGPNCGVKGLVSFDTKSRPRHEEMKTVDPNVSHTSQQELGCCSMEILAADGSETTVNDQNMVVRHKISMTISTVKSCNLEDVRPSTVSSSTSPIEQFSEVEGLEKDVVCSPSIHDPSVDDMHSANTGVGELVNSVVIDYNVDLKSSAEEQVYLPHLEGMSRSGDRQSVYFTSNASHSVFKNYDNNVLPPCYFQARRSLIDRTEASDSKLANRAEKSTSHAGRKRKKHGTWSGQYIGRILRSARRHGRQVRLRKSLQLASKGLYAFYKYSQVGWL